MQLFTYYEKRCFDSTTQVSGTYNLTLESSTLTLTHNAKAHTTSSHTDYCMNQAVAQYPKSFNDHNEAPRLRFTKEASLCTNTFPLSRPELDTKHQ